MSEALSAAEYVLPGHPDKLCDAIADALVQEARRQEQRALAAVEVAVHRASVFVTGRLACQGADGIDVELLVREVYRSAGYDERWLPDPDGLRIVTDLRREPLAGRAGVSGLCRRPGDLCRLRRGPARDQLPAG